MNEGTFKAKVINYGITASKDNQPLVTINFRVQTTETETVDMTWQNSLKEGKSQEISLDALLVCGYRENDLSLFAEGKGLDSNKVVQLVIENEMYKDKAIPKIKWINEVGSSTNKEFMAKGDAVLKLAGLNLTGAMMSRKTTMGITATAGTPPPGTGPAPF